MGIVKNYGSSRWILLWLATFAQCQVVTLSYISPSMKKMTYSLSRMVERSSSIQAPLSSKSPTTRLLLSSSSSSMRVPAISSSKEESIDFEFNEEEAIIELDDLDDDDDDETNYDIDDMIQKKQQWDEELVRLAKTSSQDPKAVEKSHAIFDKMFETFVISEDSTVWPNVNVYNLLLETHAYSKNKNGGEEAEYILSRMEDTTVDNVARPNLDTYLHVMDAWAMRRQPKRAQQIVERLERRFQETKDESLRPNVDVYNKLIKVHGMSGDTESAQSIFVNLVNGQEGDDDLKANYKTWLQTMKAYAPQPGGVEEVQNLLNQMNDAYNDGKIDFVPEVEAYNILIRAMGQTREGTYDALSMLYDMLEQYQNGKEEMRPNANTFRNVIQALKSKGGPAAAAKAEQLLQLQEGLHVATKNDDLKLDLRLYNSVLSIMARSKDSKKAIRAQRLVQKMQNSNDASLSPSVYSYYSLLNACAHTKGAPTENLAAFQVALTAINELRESDDQDANSGCIGMFLRSCANLMPISRKRDAVVERIFRKCCEDGLLNDFVLREFERAASDELQLEILGGFLEDGVRVPEEWSCNVAD